MPRKGDRADSQATVCRRPLDPDRKDIRDLLRNHYSNAKMADSVRCPCGRTLTECSKAVVYHA